MLASDPVKSEGLKFSHTCMTACIISLGGGGVLWPIYRISLTTHHTHTHTLLFSFKKKSACIMWSMSQDLDFDPESKIFLFEFGTVLTVLHFYFSFYYPGIISIQLYNPQELSKVLLPDILTIIRTINRLIKYTRLII